MAQQRTYTDREKGLATAYYEACGNIRETARKFGIPETTVRDWVHGKHTSSDVAEIRAVKKGELADRLEDLAQLLIDAIPGKVGEANLPAVSTSIGIAIDKMQLLRGKATQITDDASLTDAERANRITALLDAARARRTGQPPEADEEAVS